MMEAQNFIGGEFSKTSGLLDLVRAVQAANKALAAWQRLEIESRAQSVQSLASETLARLDDLARIESMETGVPLKATRAGVLRAVNAIEATAHAARDPSAPTHVSAQARFQHHRLPIGVVGIVSSWSDSPFQILSRVAPALAMGNAVIVKPSSRAQRTSKAIAEIVHSAGLVSGVFNLVQGRGDEIGSALVEHPGISTIAFSGRTETGREIQRLGAEFLKRLQMSLSGCNSAMVFAENDLEKTAAKVARICFSHQVPMALKATRLFVQETVYQRFLELLKSEAAKLKIGDPLDEATDLGPMIDEAALRNHEAAIAQALKENGKLLFGGPGSPPDLDLKDQAGRFARPTAIFDLTQCSTLQQEESAGPLLLISSFKYQHDALKHTASSPFGLAAYVFHANAENAQRIANKIDAGRIFINAGELLWDPKADFGGLKNSGLGREGTLEFLRFFSRETMIAADLS